MEKPKRSPLKNRHMSFGKLSQAYAKIIFATEKDKRTFNSDAYIQFSLLILELVSRTHIFK